MGVASGHCGTDFHPDKHPFFIPCAGIWSGAPVALAPVWPILGLKMSSEDLEWGEVSLRTDPPRAWCAHAKDHPQVWWRAFPEQRVGYRGGLSSPPDLPLKDGPATSFLLLCLQGLETRHGWIRSRAGLPQVVGMPGTHQQPVHSFPRDRAEDLPQGGASTQVYEEHPKASAGCAVRGFLEDRWPNGSLGRGAMAWVRIRRTPTSAEKNSWSSL